MGRRESIAGPSKLGQTERLCAILAVLVALLVRILPFADDVFQKEGVVPWHCPDVYYHLHRLEIAARAWPRFFELDLWRNYPDGAYSLWSPLFEIVPATFAALTGLPPLYVGVLWPALLGALTVILLLDLLRNLHGRAAWLGVALYVVLPGSVSFAFLGRVDHHVGEVLMQLWVYALTLRALIDLEREEPLRSARAVTLGVVIGASLWMWRGAVIYLAVVAAVALLVAARGPEAGMRREAARFFGLAFAVSVLVTAPYGVLNALRGRAAFSPYFLSLLQPALLATWALLLPLARQLGDTGLQLTPLLRARVAVPAVLALLIAATAADGVLAGAAFLTRVGDDWAATIEESQPLWSGGIPTFFVIEQVGFAPFFLLAVACVQAVGFWRARRAPSPVALLVWMCTLCGTALVFMQVRFVYYAAPLVAALPGGSWWALRERRRALRIGVVALALLSIWPVTRFWSPVFDGDPRTQMAPAPTPPWLAELLVWLLRETPSAGDVRRPDLRPSYCVLAPWDIANFIQTVSERAVLASSGGAHETPAYEDTVRFARRVTREQEAVELVQARGCSYVVTERVVPGASESKAERGRLFARRLHDHDGSDSEAHSGAGHFRLRFESRDAPPRAQRRYKVFELVRGALIVVPEGSAAAVRTRVRLVDRAFTYLRRFEPTGDGRAAVRVSHPGRYEILDGASAPLGSVDVSQEAIAKGAKLTLATAP